MGLFSSRNASSRAFGAFQVFKEMVGFKRLRGTSIADVSVLAGVGKEIRILLVRQGGEGGSLKVDVQSAPCMDRRQSLRSSGIGLEARMGQAGCRPLGRL